MENLNRGLIAVRTSPNQVFLSWRLLGTEPEVTTFNVYRDGKKLNTIPLAITTNFIDNSGNTGIYTVRAVVNNIEQKDSEKAKIWDQIGRAHV